MKYILGLLFLASTAFGALTNPPSAAEKQFFLTRNELKNPGFENTTQSWAASTGTPVLESGSNLLSGNYSLKWDPAAAGTLSSSTWTPSAVGQRLIYAQCSALISSTDFTHYKLEIYNSTDGVVVSSANLNSDPNSTNYVDTGIFYSLPGGGSSKNYRLRISADGNLSAMYLDDCYLGPAPVTAYSQDYAGEYTASVTGSSGAVSSGAKSFIGTTCSKASSVYTCTVASPSPFTANPKCNATIDGSASGQTATVASTTSIVVSTFNGSGTATDKDFTIHCSKSEKESGFAIRLDQANVATTTFTPTGTWTTNSTYTGRYSIENEFLYMQATITLAGAPNNTALSINLPFTIDTVKLSANNVSQEVPQVGDATFSDTGTTDYTGIVVYDSSTSVRVYASNASGTYTSSSNLSTTVPFTWGSGDKVTIKIKVPIVGRNGGQPIPLMLWTFPQVAYYANANQSASTTAPVNFNTQEYDNCSPACVTTGASWKFTAPISGIYEVCNQANSVSTSYGLVIYKNGSAYKSNGYVQSGQNFSPACTRLRLSPSDFIDIRPSASITASGGTLATVGTSHVSVSWTGN